MPDGLAPFIHINQNEILGRKHTKLKEEDISTCECKYDVNDPNSACGDRCLNVLTNTECTPGYCPCSEYCKNQRFQKWEYAKTRLFKTEGRGWGMLADENIKAGEFIIEYCGEVISSEEAKMRSQIYEVQGLKDAYIISLDATHYIDATKKGSLARFINHSCQPNCETRKWTVLGETRVGIFSKQEILVGTELSYDYNFEWYGGATVRCLCGAPNCSIFLGARSQGFQEYNHVWEDGDDRYTVEEVPLYDSAEDEPFSKIQRTTSSVPLASLENDYSMIIDGNVGLDSTPFSTDPRYLAAMEGVTVFSVKTEATEEPKLYPQDNQKPFQQTNPMISRIQSNIASRRYNIGPDPVMQKKSQQIPHRKPKKSIRKELDAKHVAQLFASKEARDEILKCEEIRSQASSKLNSLYDEIRPAIEEHDRDSQDSVHTGVAEKWIGANCSKIKADFDLYFSVVKNVLCAPPAATSETKLDTANEVKYLTN